MVCSAPETVMRTLLRHAATGQYFQALERWTRNPARAYDFKAVNRAVRFVQKAGFRGMELVLSLDSADKVTWGQVMGHPA
jgi:hypothetical protein